MISKNRILISLKHGGFLVSHFLLYISQDRIFIQKNQVYFFYHKIKNRFGYIKFDFVISQSGRFIVHTGLFQDFINNNF